MHNLFQVSRDANVNQGMRRALIEAAAWLIATEGAGALTLRRVTEEVGTSTMAVYTHFGGMPELRRAVRAEGVARLAEKLEHIEETDDPVADLVMMGIAYNENATSNPHLYRVMYMEMPLDETDAGVYLHTNEVLSGAIERCIAAGRFASAKPGQLAIQFWSIGHGPVTWQLADLFSPEEAREYAGAGLLSLFVGWGDHPDAARASLSEAARRAGLGSAQTHADTANA